MICRVINNTLMFFDKRSSKTGIVSGNDFYNVCRWVESGQQSVTITLLNRQGLLDDSHKTMILSAVNNPLNPISRAMAVPESIHIELTSRCNLRCSQCYKNLAKQTDIDYEFLKRVLTEAGEIKVFQIAFGGGEPLLYPYLDEAIELASSYNMGCSVTTNGSLLTSKRLKELMNAGLDHIQVSLNGTTERMNEMTREGFADAKRALELLSITNISFGVNMTLSNSNISDLENMIIYVKSLCAENLNLLRYKPSAVHGLDQGSLSEEDYKKIKGLIPKYNCNRFSIKVDSAFGNLIAYANAGQLDGNYTGCTAGRRFVSVDVDGLFKACSHLKQSERADSIMDFWLNGNLVSQIRSVEENISEPCYSCKFIKNCRGCRAICEAKYSNYFSGEKDCFAYRSNK